MAVKTPTKFTPQEIEQFKDLQTKINQLTLQFGQLQMNKIKLKESEDLLSKQYQILEKEEIDLAKNITAKYGKGSLDIETGEFTSTE